MTSPRRYQRGFTGLDLGSKALWILLGLFAVIGFICSAGWVAGLIRTLVRSIRWG